MPSLDQLLHTIEAIYDAGLDEAQWTIALERLSDLLGCTGTTVAFQDSSGRFPAYHSVRCLSDLHHAYAEHYRRIDPVLAFVSRAAPGVYIDRMILPKTELRRLEIHSDFGIPNDMDSVMQAFAFRSAAGAGFVAAGRSVRAGDFEAEHVQTMGLLLPHLERAMQMQLRLGAVGMRADSAAEALDCLTLGILFVDQRARVLLANRAAEALLAQADGIGVDAAGLCAARQTETSALRRIIVRAADHTRVNGRGGSLQLERPSMRRSLLVMVAPLGRSSSAWMPQPRPAAIVLVSDPESACNPPLDALRMLFGLTPTEAAVALAVAEGRGVKDAADALGISSATVRWHLQRVFDKTGTARQAELARVVGSLRMIRPDGTV